MMSRPALLRVCARCEWIFEAKDKDNIPACPKCEFGSYSAHYVHGRLAYSYKLTQEPYMNRMMYTLQGQIVQEVKDYNDEHYPGWDDPPY